jgi:NAD(P)-dependent dehydrogenase (short-subunit alcohol dehydrogenase family)
MSRLEQLFSLRGKRALITGGSSGIGLAMAQALGEAGAAVILSARHEPQLRAAQTTLHALGISCDIICADLGEPEGPDHVAEAITGVPIDIVVNAAGINLRQPFQDVTAAAFDLHMALHVRAPFRLTQLLAPAMAARGYGRIIMIASLQSYRAFPHSAPYGAAKGAVVQLTRAIAEEWSARGITCNAVAPGFFPTALTAPVFADAAVAQMRAGQTAIGRNGVLEDLAGATIFLASPASAYITGQTLAADGGFTAK